VRAVCVPPAWIRPALGISIQLESLLHQHGGHDGREKRIVLQVVDLKDLSAGLTAMQRTVGFTLSLGARLILDGKIPKRGLLTTLDIPYDAIFPALEKHHIRVQRIES
jgi:saccharopine dehydrogenase-like NADP-dependent oxidoreductase